MVAIFAKFSNVCPFFKFRIVYNSMKNDAVDVIFGYDPPNTIKKLVFGWCWKRTSQPQVPADP